MHKRADTFVAKMTGMTNDPGKLKYINLEVVDTLLTQLGRLVTVGDKFEWKDKRFEVIDIDGRRVDKVLVMPLKPPTR